MSYDVNGTIEYYKDLLLYQYNDKPRARATIGLLAAQAICDLLILEVNDAFALETAAGVQLDVIGEYVGINRLTNLGLLNDSDYRYLMTLKIILNNLDNTLQEINDSLFTFFGSDVICVDQADMSISYFIQGVATALILSAVYLGLLPKPMGVRISGVFLVPAADKVMKFMDYNFDTGADVEFADYTTGFNDKVILDYLDKVA